MLKDKDLNPGEKILLVNVFDKIFGLDLDKIELSKKDLKIPDEIIELAEKRKDAKKNKDFTSADELRKKILEKGYEIKDSKSGEYVITKV